MLQHVSHHYSEVYTRIATSHLVVALDGADVEVLGAPVARDLHLLALVEPHQLLRGFLHERQQRLQRSQTRRRRSLQQAHGT